MNFLSPTSFVSITCSLLSSTLGTTELIASVRLPSLFFIKSFCLYETIPTGKSGLTFMLFWFIFLSFLLQWFLFLSELLKWSLNLRLKTFPTFCTAVDCATFLNLNSSSFGRFSKSCSMLSRFSTIGYSSNFSCIDRKSSNWPTSFEKFKTEQYSSTWAFSERKCSESPSHVWFRESQIDFVLSWNIE